MREKKSKSPIPPPSIFQISSGLLGWLLLINLATVAALQLLILPGFPQLRTSQAVIATSLVFSVLTSLAGFFLYRTWINLRESTLQLETRYKNTFSKAEEGIALVSAWDYRILEANSKFLSIIDASELNIKHKGLTDLLSGDRESVLDIFRKAKSGENQSGDFLLQNSTSQKKILSGSVTYIAGPGEPLFLIIGHDVTQARKTLLDLEENQRRLEGITQGMLDAVLQLDYVGIITYATPSIAALLGYQPKELVGTNILKIFHVEDLQQANRFLLSPDVSDQDEPFQTLRAIDRNGKSIYIEIFALKEFKNGELATIRLGVREITNKVESQMALIQNESRLRRITDGMLDVVCLCSRDGTIEYITPSVESVLGFSPADLVGKNFLELSLQKDFNLLQNLFQEPSYRSEARFSQKNGEPRWLEFVSNQTDENGLEAKHVIGLRDISARKLFESQIQHLALHDALTGLGNRRMLSDRAEQILAVASRKEWSTALLFIDLDRFKDVNDTLGHDVGDDLLVQTGWIIKHSTRAGDILVRYSGDEFVVILTEASETEAVQTAERILQNFHQPLDASGHKITVEASIGISMFPQHGQNLATLLKAADIAMYKAKQTGNSIEVYSDRLNPYNQEQLELETSIRKAVSAEDFKFWYQPIFSAKTREIVGFEALARWDHDGLSTVPSVFIPLAERLHLIESIDLQGLKSSLLLQKEHKFAKEPLKISVNLSAVTLRDPNFAEKVKYLALEVGASLENIYFEITETILLQDLEGAQTILKDLRNLGAKIAIDDFGNGFASLTYLRHLSVDRIKLDRTLVSQIGRNSDGERLLKAMIQLGRTLELEVLAEGIETETQLEWLANANCNLIQGFLLGRPMSDSKVGKLLKSSQNA